MNRFYLFCFISGFYLPLNALGANPHIDSSYRGVCESHTHITKFYQQGVEFWGTEVFFDGQSLESWINQQDSAGGASGGYTCRIEKALPLDPKFIAAVKNL